MYGTSKVKIAAGGEKQVLVTRYFPNLLEHRDIINLASQGGIEALYFYEASRGQGPFLSQMDHDHLEEYHAFGLKVYWVCPLNNRLMVHTMREDMGYFVAPGPAGRFSQVHAVRLLRLQQGAFRQRGPSAWGICWTPSSPFGASASASSPAAAAG